MTQLILEGESDKIAQVIEFAKDLKLSFHTALQNAVPPLIRRKRGLDLCQHTDAR